MDDAAVFCERLRPGLVGALSLHVGDAGIAEELAQETLVRAWSRWPQVREMDAPEAWAYRVAANLANSWWRRRAAEWRANRRHGAHDRHADGRHHDRERDIVLRQAVSALPRRQRQALVLRYYVGCSITEAARVMGCAPGTVKALCHQAVARLREQRIHLDTPSVPVLPEVTGDG